MAGLEDYTDRGVANVLIYVICMSVRYISEYLGLYMI